MVKNPAVGLGQQIVPDQVVRIEISRSAAAESAQVRVFVIDAREPYLFEFQDMAAAIEFYEHLWSLRTSRNDAAASHSA